MPFEIYSPDEESKYNNGILLEEYKGIYCLYSATKSLQGPVYKRWAYPQQRKGDPPADTAVPMRVILGSSRQAVKRLRFFLEQLTNENGQDGA